MKTFSTIRTKPFPSDISKEQYATIAESLENFKKRTRPREVDLYEVFCAVLYILKGGCQWRMLPKDFPKWETVYAYHNQWRERKDAKKPSLLEEVLQKIVVSCRTQQGRKEKTSFCIIDSQSVKNTDTAKLKGYDAGKKISGIKRHIGVDTQGLPHAICITTANVTDRAGAIMMMAEAKDNLSSVEKCLVDGGYTGENFAQQVKAIIGAEVEVAKRSELHKFVVLPKRWVVERCFAWMDKYRRLWKNCERKINSSLQFIVLAFISILLKRL